MDELTIDGKVYVSSKRAAGLSGYAKDYIGQLCREGRVESKLVGRSWYVYEPSLKEHRFADDRSKGKNNQEKQSQELAESSEITNIQAVWEQPSYTPETFVPLPTVAEEKPIESNSTLSTVPVETLSEMQSAWQDWFSSQHVQEKPAMQATTVEDPALEAPNSSIEDEEENNKDEEVPVRMIVSDIEPKRAYKTVEVPVALHREVPMYRTHIQTPTDLRGKGSKKRSLISNAVPVQAVLIAFMVLVVSITLISTGIIDNFHLVGSADSGIFQFLQGNTVIEK